MKKYLPSLLVLAMLFLSACQTAECPPDRISYLEDTTLFPQEKMEANTESGFDPIRMEIKGAEIQVDRVISGSVCNDTWSGVIYVSCDIQIATWQDDPIFFQDCDLDIAWDAVVYVEAHNDKAYYEGCSCHK